MTTAAPVASPIFNAFAKPHSHLSLPYGVINGAWAAGASRDRETFIRSSWGLGYCLV
ncbi:hypothetical protein BC826DRAFT_1048920, partial [Russula brevipes]